MRAKSRYKGPKMQVFGRFDNKLTTNLQVNMVSCEWI